MEEPTITGPTAPPSPPPHMPSANLPAVEGIVRSPTWHASPESRLVPSTVAKVFAGGLKKSLERSEAGGSDIVDNEHLRAPVWDSNDVRRVSNARLAEIDALVKRDAKQRSEETWLEDESDMSSSDGTEDLRPTCEDTERTVARKLKRKRRRERAPPPVPTLNEQMEAAVGRSHVILQYKVLGDELTKELTVVVDRIVELENETLILKKSVRGKELK